jgi:RNase P subunit RPR2
MDNRRKKVIKSSVHSSIKKLLEQARDAYKKKDMECSRKYVKMAFNLLKKNKVKLPKELRNSFCKKCYMIWIPAKTVTVVYDKKDNCLRLRCRCGHSKRL